MPYMCGGCGNEVYQQQTSWPVVLGTQRGAAWSANPLNTLKIARMPGHLLGLDYFAAALLRTPVSHRSNATWKASTFWRDKME